MGHKREGTSNPDPVNGALSSSYHCRQQKLNPPGETESQCRSKSLKGADDEVSTATSHWLRVTGREALTPVFPAWAAWVSKMVSMPQKCPQGLRVRSRVFVHECSKDKGIWVDHSVTNLKGCVIQWRQLAGRLSESSSSSTDDSSQ